MMVECFSLFNKFNFKYIMISTAQRVTDLLK